MGGSPLARTALKKPAGEAEEKSANGCAFTLNIALNSYPRKQ